MTTTRVAVIGDPKNSSPDAPPRRMKIVDSSGLVTEYENGELTRVSVERASRVQPGLSAAGADDIVTIHHFGDDSLVERVIRLRRSIEDAKRCGRDSRADERDLLVTRALQRVRLRLRWRYNARDAYGQPGNQGTDVWSQCYRNGELPSYALAFSIDRQRFESGKSHIVAWQVAA